MREGRPQARCLGLREAALGGGQAVDRRGEADEASAMARTSVWMASAMVVISSKMDAVVRPARVLVTPGSAALW